MSMNWLLALLLLVACSPQQESTEMSIDVQMRAYTYMGERLDFTIMTENADSIRYNFWYQHYDNGWGSFEWVHREGPFEYGFQNKERGVTSYFRTCEPASMPNPIEQITCAPDWLMGSWELRVVVWRWSDGQKDSVTHHKRFNIIG